MLLQRGRNAEPLPPLQLRAEGKTLALALPSTWLAAHPLTRADLESERDYLKLLDIKLQVREIEKLVAA